MLRRWCRGGEWWAGRMTRLRYRSQWRALELRLRVVVERWEWGRIAIQPTSGFCLRAGDSHLWKHSHDLDHQLTLILILLTNHWLDHRLIVLNPQAQSMIPMCCHEIHKHYFMYAKMVLVWQLAVKQPTYAFSMLALLFYLFYLEYQLFSLDSYFITEQKLKVL